MVRLYLDVALAVSDSAAVAAGRRGPPLSEVNLGGQQADPSMLMAPALLLLALGSLALRFFPVLAAIASREAADGKGLLGALATWQLSREPVHYGRITFLLALAIGIGWFATSFRATVTNSHDDQARYLVGSDARLVERDTQLNANRARPVEFYEAQDGVAEATTGYRIINANLSTSIAGELRGNILAINPDTFGDVLYWRTDLGSIYTPRASGDPPPLPERGEALPFVPSKIGMWLRFERRLRFASDRTFRASVGRLEQVTNLGLGAGCTARGSGPVEP